MNRKINIKDSLFYWSLILVLLTLPFPKYNINSISIILCFVFWLFNSSFQNKFNNLKRNFPIFLIISSIFWISLTGLVYSQEFDEGLKKLQNNLPFLVFPLILFSINFKKTYIQIILKYFSYSVIIASLFALTKAFYFKVYNLGDFFYFDQLKIVLEKHTTYFALFTVVAIAYFISEFLNKKWADGRKYLIPILFLFSMLYMLSVRISIISLVFVFFIFSNEIKSNFFKKKAIIFIIIIIPFIVYFTPNFQNRFNSKTPEGIEISDINSRIIHWKAVLSIINKNNLIFGAGTGDGHLGLYDEYRKHNFVTGYIYKYNAHNQYLEIILYFGFIGLFLLLLVVFTVLIKCYQANDLLGVTFVFVFLVFMITESILERHSGIVLFSYIMSLFSIPSNE